MYYFAQLTAQEFHVSSTEKFPPENQGREYRVSFCFQKKNKNKKDVNLTGHQTLQWLTVGWEENLTQHSCWDFGIYISCTTTKLAPCFCQWPPPNSGLPTQACWEQVWVQVVPVKLLPTLMGKCLGNASSTADHCCYFSPERRCVEMPC